MKKNHLFPLLVMSSWLIFIQIVMRLTTHFIVSDEGIFNPAITFLMVAFYIVAFVFSVFLGWASDENMLIRILVGVGLFLGTSFAFIWGVNLIQIHFGLIAAWLFILVSYILKSKTVPT